MTLEELEAEYAAKDALCESCETPLEDLPSGMFIMTDGYGNCHYMTITEDGRMVRVDEL